MGPKNFFDYIEKNDLSVRIEKMHCVETSVYYNFDKNWRDKYYTVWVVSGGDVCCSGTRNEPLANVVNRWANTIEYIKQKENLA